MAVLDYLLKLRRGPGLAFSAEFLHENLPYIILYRLAKFQCHIFFPSRDIKQNVLLSPYLDKC